MGRIPSGILAPGEEGGGELQDAARAVLAVAVVPDEPGLDHVNLGLGLRVHHPRDQGGKPYGVLLVVKELELQGAAQAVVVLVGEGLPLEAKAPM